MLALCKWLVSLYPAPFRSRVGESMLQMVIDSLAGCSEIGKLQVAGDLILGAAIENAKSFQGKYISERIFKQKVLTAIGFVLALPGAVILSLLLLGIEPPLGPLEYYLKGNEELSKWVGTAFVLGTIIVLPTIGVLIATVGEKRFFIFSFVSAAALSLFLVLPFVALQFIYGRRSYSGFPVFLFAVLWILPTIAIFLVGPIVSRMRSEQGLSSEPYSIALRVFALIPIAIMWFALVQDQMPCFLGVPNCD